MNLTGLRNLYEITMYDDRVWVWRHEEVFNYEYGDTKNLLPTIHDKDKAIFQNIKCRVSLNNYKDTTKDANSYNIPIDPMPQLFWHPRYKIKEGDYVEIHRRESNEIYIGYVGQPQMYDSHYQALLRSFTNA